MIEKLAKVKVRLRGEQQDHLHPAERAAEAVLKLLAGAWAEPALGGVEGTPAPTSRA
jgi:hypothetical protein